jgi:hypothetical protein
MTKVITDQDLGTELEIVNKKLRVKKEARIFVYNNLLVFKIPENTTDRTLEINDYCQGFVEGQFINANYLGGNTELLTSFNI